LGKRVNALRLLGAKWLLIAGLNLAFGLTLLALDPDRSLTQYGIDRWGAQNGLPQDKVQAITQTTDGYLWIGTLHGLAKFDGVRFTRFIPTDAPELGAASVHGLYTARDGSLWIGTDFEGLAHWKDGRTEWYRSQQPFATELRCIREDRNGAVWITAQEGVFQVADHRLVPEALNLLRVFDLAPDPNGGVWVGAERGLFHVPGNGRRMDPWKGASGPAGWIFAVLPLADGTLWAGGGGGLAILKNGRWTIYSEKDGLPNPWVRCLLKDSHGSLWAGTFGGLARLSKGYFESLTVKDGLSDREVGALFEDREGSLWIGTRGGGMTRLRDVPAVTFNLASGNTRNPTAPFEDAEGRVWSGTDEGSLLQYRDGG
jgi:ligand-binding sensor domain-containing protein